MEVQILSKKLIVPTTPAQDHPHSIKLCLLDQFAPRSYVRYILYYQETETGGKTDRVTRMERSLADTLSVFYPFAGRLNEDGMSIGCNNRGAEFIEAKVSNCLLSDHLVEDPDTKLLSRFVPSPYQNSGEAPLVSVQVNVFECGGIALGLSMSHVLCDGYTVALFLNAWASYSRSTDGLVDRVYLPSFGLASVFPPIDIAVAPTLQQLNAVWGEAEPERGSIVMRKFVFDGGAISRLKVVCTDNADAGKPSRVQAVWGFLWRSMMRAKGRVRPSMAFLPVNLRGRTKNIRVPSNPCGNFAMPSLPLFNPKGGDDDPLELREFARLTRDSIRNTVTRASELDADGLVSMIGNIWGELKKAVECEGRDVYYFTSWCRMGHYDADFGWGRPSGTSFPHAPMDGLAGLMDARDGEGIEAWVSLDLHSMLRLQQDPDIVAFTSDNHGRVLDVKD